VLKPVFPIRRLFVDDGFLVFLCLRDLS